MRRSTLRNTPVQFRLTREIVTEVFPQGAIAPVRVGRQVRLLRVQLREEGEPLQAGSGDLSRIYRLPPLNQLPEVVPIECGGIFEYRQEGVRIKSVARLPELEHDEPADERSVQRSGRKGAEVVDVARLGSLIAGPDLLGYDLGQGKACDIHRGEWQVSEVVLNALSVPR